VTALRERLAQMGETARAATPESDIAGESDAEHIATFSPDVAAALVAVADAVESLVACPLCGMTSGRHFQGGPLPESLFPGNVGKPCPMHALAAALGVSR
jgi:hypothetical protein